MGNEELEETGWSIPHSLLLTPHFSLLISYSSFLTLDALLSASLIKNPPQAEMPRGGMKGGVE